MAGETRVDPEGVLRLLRNLDNIGADIKDALVRVQVVRATVAEPWGNDEHGQRFAGDREANAKTVLAGVDEMIAYINELVAEGRVAINDFVALDSANAKNLAP